MKITNETAIQNTMEQFLHDHFFREHSSVKAQESELLKGLIKDAFKTADVPDILQDNPHHDLSLYDHTESVMLNVWLMLRYAERGADVLAAAKYHDIGKPDVVSTNPQTGFDQFLAHSQASVEKTQSLIDSDFNVKSEVSEYAMDLIKLHDTKYAGEGQIKEMLDTHLAGFAKDLILLQYSDIMGQGEYHRAEKLQELKDFAERIIMTGTEKPEQSCGIKEFIQEVIDAQYKITTSIPTKTALLHDLMHQLNKANTEGKRLYPEVVPESIQITTNPNNNELCVSFRYTNGKECLITGAEVEKDYLAALRKVREYALERSDPCSQKENTQSSSMTRTAPPRDSEYDR